MNKSIIPKSIALVSMCSGFILLVIVGLSIIVPRIVDPSSFLEFRLGTLYVWKCILRPCFIIVGLLLSINGIYAWQGQKRALYIIGLTFVLIGCLRLLWLGAFNRLTITNYCLILCCTIPIVLIMAHHKWSKV